jgi:hypothetical protein
MSTIAAPRAPRAPAGLDLHTLDFVIRQCNDRYFLLVLAAAERNGGGVSVAGSRPRSMAGATALSCRTAVAFAQDTRELVESLGVSLSPYSASGEHTFDVLVNAKAGRVTRLADSGETPVWTIVRHDSGGGSLWDHDTRRVFEVPGDELVRTPAAPTAGFEVRLRSRDNAGRATILLQDTAAGLLRLELNFDRGNKLRRHGPALLWLLYGGPACHRNSGWPLERLEKLGCLTRGRLYHGSDETPLCTVEISDHRIDRVTAKDFEPPRNFRRAKPQERRPVPQEEAPSLSRYEPDGVPVLPVEATGIPTALRRDALMERHDQFTPDCLGSTRFGSIAALFHQDALDHLRTLINTAAPFLGTATLSGSTLAIDWLGALATIRATPTPAAGAMAPGSGIFCFLRDVPRLPGPPARGGTGLLDKIAVANLIRRPPGEQSFLEQQVASGAIVNTMQSWGITTTSLISDLVGVGGDLRRLPMAEQITIVEAFETMALGMFKLDLGIPEKLEVKDVVSGQITQLSGTMNFGALGGMPLVSSAMIGNSANVTIGITLPPTAVTATVDWKLSPTLVGAGAAIALGACVLLPFLCPVASLGAAALANGLNERVNVITASTSGATITFDIRYEWDEERGVVGPAVDVLSTSGSVSTQISSPSAYEQEAALIATALVNYWVNLLAVLAGELAKQLRDALRGQGLELPAHASETGLAAVSGSATSFQNSRLLLQAELTTDPATGSQPYATQVPDSSSLAAQLDQCHAVMRASTTPAVPPAPLALYAGLAPSQNALNHYMGARWRQGAFRAEFPLGAWLTRLLRLAPAGAFTATVVAVHAWSASCPRVEIAEGELAAQELPLVAFFDDLRICFEGLPPANSDRLESTICELSLNVRTPAAVTLAGPFIPRVLFSAKAADIEISDVRVGELVDPNQPVKAATTDLQLWEPLATEVARAMFSEHDAAQLTDPPPPIAWPTPIPHGKSHELVHIDATPPLTPQSVYLELLGRRRALYLLPVVRTTLLELVDGSTAPMLNTLVGGMGVTPATMTCPQGATLRGAFAAAFGEFVIPP